MAILPKVKLQTVVNFPSQADGGPLISVTKTGALYTISFDPSEIQRVDGIIAGETSSTYFFTWNPTTDVFSLVKYSNAAAPGGGEKLITAAANVTIADDESATIIGITNTSGIAIDVLLPDAVIRRSKIVIVDRGLNANTHNITVKPKNASGQTLMGGASYVMDSNGMSIGLTPWDDGSGYF